MTKLMTACRLAKNKPGFFFQFAGRKINLELKRFVANEEGQSTTEYILILAVVVMVAMKFKTTFQGKLNNAVNTLGGKIDAAVAED